MTHAAIGSRIAKKWGLPQPLCAVIKRHHQPKSNADQEELVLIVHTADALVNTYLNSDFASTDWPICLAARQILASQIESAPLWLNDLQSEIDSGCQILLEE